MERYNATRHAEQDERDRLLRELLGEVGEGVVVRPPFRCDYGTYISIGARHVRQLRLRHARRGADQDRRRVPGRDQRAAPDRDAPDRSRSRAGAGWEYAEPITIGDNVWLGGGAIVCPGVTIGDDTVVGAGAIVTRDLPAGVVAVGNPARVQREIGEQDRVDVPER